MCTWIFCTINEGLEELYEKFLSIYKIQKSAGW